MKTPTAAWRALIECYLDAFTSPSGCRAPGAPANQQWFNSRKVSGKWRISCPPEMASVFPAGPAGDGFDEPLVREKLDLVRARYPETLRKLEGGVALGEGEALDLSFFVSTVLRISRRPRAGRRPNLLERACRAAEILDTWPENQRARADAAAALIPARKIMREPAGATLLDDEMNFILNRTALPFITSDLPAIAVYAHPDELRSALPSLSYVDSSAVRGARKRVVLLPLSPRVLVVSSRLIRGTGHPYSLCAERRVVLAFNMLTCLAARHLLIANTDRPFGESEPTVQTIIRSL